MTRKKAASLQLPRWALSILALLLVLKDFTAVSAGPHAARNSQLRHKCVHDTHVNPSLTQEVGSKRLQEGASSDVRRKLLVDSVPAPLRITPVFQLDNLDILPRSFLSIVLVPSATRFLQRLYAARYPVAGNLLLERSCSQMLTGEWSNGTTFSQCAQWAPLTCLECSLDAQHFDAYTTCSSASECIHTPAGNGLADTDFILYVTAKNTSTCQTGTIAYASFCTQDGATDRPTSGSANFCPDQITPAQNWAFKLDTAVHELTHALGFSAALFKYYRDADNVPFVPRNADGSLPDTPDLSAVIGTFSERGTTATKLITPKVTQAARAQFGCSTLNGAELENDGGSGTAGSHWEERIYMGELMTAVSQQKPAYSVLTAATLEDSGWYVPSYDVTQPLLWGRGRGCAFPLASCAPGGPVPVDPAFSGFYCGVGFRSWTDDNNATSVLEHMCTDDDAAVGYCQPCNTEDGTCLTDGCMPIVPLSNYVCTNASVSLDLNTSSSSSLAFWGQTFGVGSKCISDGSQTWSKGGFERPPVGGGCFQYQCTWDVTGTQASLSVLVGDHSIPCIDGQEVSLAAAGFDSGSIGPCPVANAFCEDSGCVNDCSNQGFCMDGTCRCLIGWAGTDCSRLQCNDGLCPPNTVCDPISGSCLLTSVMPSASPSFSPVAFQPGPSFSAVPSPFTSALPSPSASQTSNLPSANRASPSPQPSPSVRPSTAPTMVSARVVLDGYLAKCTLCMDANSNLRCDDGELTARSDATGGFLIQNVTSQTYGPLLLKLGDSSCVDVLTRLSPTTIMVAPLGFTVVSPLTTLVQALIESGHLTESAAESTARNALELPSTIQISSEDPIEGLLENDEGSLDLLKATACVNNVAAQFGALLAGLSGGASDETVSLSVYQAMATVLLESQSSTSPAKASHVPSSAEAVSIHTSCSSTDQLPGAPHSLSDGASKCPVDRKVGDLPSSQLPRIRLLDVSTASSFNLSDVSTLQSVLNASVSNAQASGALLPGTTVSADVAASVISLAASMNGLVAAVGSENATLNLQTLGQLSVAARGPVLSSIQEVGVGNLSVATFVANSAPDRLALVGSTAEMGTVTSQATSAPAPGPPASPAATAAAAAGAGATSAAGTGVYLIAGLLVGLLLVLGGTVAFVFWRWRKMMLEREEKKEGDELTKSQSRSKKRRSKRVTDEVREEVNAERELERREQNGTEQSDVDYESESGSFESENRKHSRRHRRGSKRQHFDESNSREDKTGSRKERGTRERPQLESGSQTSEEENQDKALILNRGTSTAAIAHTPKSYANSTGGYDNQTSDSKKQNGSYIYAPQQIIIINQRDGSEDDIRQRHSAKHVASSKARHVPQISATTTATLALEDAPRNREPYVTVPSDEEQMSGQDFSVTEVNESSPEDVESSTNKDDRVREKNDRPHVQQTSLPVVESFAATTDGLLVSKSSGPVMETQTQVNEKPFRKAAVDETRDVKRVAAPSQASQPVIEAFTLTDKADRNLATLAQGSQVQIAVRGGSQMHGKQTSGNGERNVPEEASQVRNARGQEARKAGGLEETRAASPASSALLGEANPVAGARVLGKRPDSAPVKPASYGASNQPRPQSAMQADGRRVQQTSPLRAQSKPAWEEKQGAESRDQRSVEATGKTIAAASQGSPVRLRTADSTLLGSGEKPSAASPIGKKPSERSPPRVATARFTFDVETPESSGGQQTPFARPPNSPRAPNPALNPPKPPQEAGFARVSLALLKKAAPVKEEGHVPVAQKQASGKNARMPDLQRQDSHVPVLRRQLSVEAPTTVLSATRPKSPQKKDLVASKAPGSPRLAKSPTGGEAQTATGSDQVARTPPPKTEPGKARAKGDVSPSRVVGKNSQAAAKTAGVVVDLRKGGK